MPYLLTCDQHDLTEQDRAAIVKGSQRLLYTVTTCSVGLAALGVYAAVRRRRAVRGALAHLPHDVSIRATTESGQKLRMDAPRLTMDPSRERVAFFFNATFLGLLGAFVGSEIGFVGGGAWARRTMANEGDLVRDEYLRHFS